MAKFPYAPDQDGFGVEAGEESVMVKLAGGRPRIRRDIIGAWSTTECQWTCNPTMFNAIQVFYDTTIEHGSLQFTIDLYSKNANALTEHEAIIVPGSYKPIESHKGQTFVVRATLMFNPVPVTP